MTLISNLDIFSLDFFILVLFYFYFIVGVLVINIHYLKEFNLVQINYQVFFRTRVLKSCKIRIFKENVV